MTLVSGGPLRGGAARGDSASDGESGARCAAFCYGMAMIPHPAIIYRIIAKADWAAAQAAGAFRGTAHDLRDGFIHFSTAAQAAETAARHYAGLDDLLLLYVDTAKLAAPLKWEASRNGDLFPHLYGALPAAAVQRVAALPLDAAGRHVFPDDMP
ncbi:MAG TPA: DUF952 domain-containing protein [Ferrovibrio sp.]|uniref:DUF952 domain-containing protein n=1 Tax=Ferrovibrio sp. TaxID=1917215 RepID=UPI002ED40B63